jgi:hypothetical protein
VKIRHLFKSLFPAPELGRRRPPVRERLRRLLGMAPVEVRHVHEPDLLRLTRLARQQEDTARTLKGAVHAAVESRTGGVSS